MEPLQDSVISDIEERYALQPASIAERFANYLVDHIVLYFVYKGVGYLIGKIIFANNPDDYVLIVTSMSFRFLLVFLCLLVGLLYFTLIEGATNGRSIGKLFTKTIVVKEDTGGAITFKDALIRSACRYIPFDQLTAFSGRPWHDRISKTRVIEKR